MGGSEKRDQFGTVNGRQKGECTGQLSRGSRLVYLAKPACAPHSQSRLADVRLEDDDSKVSRERVGGKESGTPSCKRGRVCQQPCSNTAINVAVPLAYGCAWLVVARARPVSVISGSFAPTRSIHFLRKMLRSIASKRLLQTPTACARCLSSSAPAREAAAAAATSQANRTFSLSPPRRPRKNCN